MFWANTNLEDYFYKPCVCTVCLWVRSARIMFPQCLISSSSSWAWWWGRIACSWPRSHVHHGCHGTCPTLQSSQRIVHSAKHYRTQPNVIEHSKTLSKTNKLSDSAKHYPTKHYRKQQNISKLSETLSNTSKHYRTQRNIIERSKTLTVTAKHYKNTAKKYWRYTNKLSKTQQNSIAQIIIENSKKYWTAKHYQAHRKT